MPRCGHIPTYADSESEEAQAYLRPTPRLIATLTLSPDRVTPRRGPVSRMGRIALSA
jgi:hypothetical protein